MKVRRDGVLETQPVSGAVDVSDRVSREVGRVRDRYMGGEILADQLGDGTVKTFTFSSPVQLVWIRFDGGNGRVDPFGGTPDLVTDAGIFCENGIPTPITVQCTVLKAIGSVGSIRVYGYRE